MRKFRLLFTLVFMTISMVVFSQTAPGGGTSTPSCWPPSACTSVPVDGGIAFLMAAGALYGAKRLKKSI
jgi:hypothetical protein